MFCAQSGVVIAYMQSEADNGTMAEDYSQKDETENKGVLDPAKYSISYNFKYWSIHSDLQLSFATTLRYTYILLRQNFWASAAGRPFLMSSLTFWSAATLLGIYSSTFSTSMCSVSWLTGRRTTPFLSAIM